MQISGTGKETETKTETQAGLAVAQDDSVALAALPRRPSSVESRDPSLRTLNSDEGEGLPFLVSFGIISRQGARRWWIDRIPFRICTCGGRPIRIRGMARSRAAPWQFWIKATCSRAGFRLRLQPMARPPRPSECIPVVLVA